MQSQQDFIYQQGSYLMEAQNYPTQGMSFESLSVKPLQESMDIEDQKVSIDTKVTKDDSEDLEQVGGKDLYKTLINSNMLCTSNAWKRVLREAQEINANFRSLKTCIGVVTDTIGALHFLLYPGDGAMADKPLCGRILIPRDYPTIPPVVHLFTRTNRYNVDIYNYFTEPDMLQDMHSSMCFDILRPKSQHGIWNPEYTLSALISSLLQAIVSIKVAQEGGGEVAEFVSMEKLSSIHKSVETTYSHYHDIMPSRKEIIHLQGMQVPTKHFKFPEKMATYKHNQDLIIQSNPIFLQVPDEKIVDNVYSIGFDLSDLKTNPATVFSIILSNDPWDPVGRKRETILIRNGVTATAAKKRFGTPMDWFYHGKPMNESDLKLIVTIGHNQFCISYYDGERKAIHGDFPVSYLTRAEIGSVGKQPFYLSVLLKNKGGPSITVKTFMPEHGYIHPGAAGSQ